MVLGQHTTSTAVNPEMILSLQSYLKNNGS